MMKQLEDYFFNNSIAIRRITILVILIVLGMIDLIKGYEVSFAVFYLIPISIAAWYDNKNMTIVTIILSALTWLYADYGAGHEYSNALIPFWNALVRICFFCVVASLIFRIKKVLHEMTEMAMKDSLTQLYNFRAFQYQYSNLRKISHQKKYQYAICIIDLDGFKRVNDTYGHSKGDDVLIKFSQVLKESLNYSDLLARMGGDEFVVLLNDTNTYEIERYEKKLRRLFAFTEMKKEYLVDFSMGVRLFTVLPENVDDAKHSADQLMYQSKSLGKSQTTIQLFS